MFGLTPRDVGRPFQDLEISYRPVELRAQIEEALQHPAADLAARRRVGARRRRVGVPRHPVRAAGRRRGAPRGRAVIFNDVTQYRQLQNELVYANRQLETAYEELQSTNEELETTNEELQSTVEELETTNEELQSTNEELETMNEELQSMNDELNVSNEALREHQDEVEPAQRVHGLDPRAAWTPASPWSTTTCACWPGTTAAEDLWGVRTDEVVGDHLFNLDIGLPLDTIRSAVRAQLDDASSAAASTVIDAVNRRGRSLQVRVTLTPVQGRAGEEPAVMLMMDVVKPQD